MAVSRRVAYERTRYSVRNLGKFQLFVGGIASKLKIIKNMQHLTHGRSSHPRDVTALMLFASALHNALDMHVYNIANTEPFFSLFHVSSPSLKDCILIFTLLTRRGEIRTDFSRISLSFFRVSFYNFTHDNFPHAHYNSIRLFFRNQVERKTMLTLPARIVNINYNVACLFATNWSYHSGRVTRIATRGDRSLNTYVQRESARARARVAVIACCILWKNSRSPHNRERHSRV